jgi:hypothetical protein
MRIFRGIDEALPDEFDPVAAAPLVSFWIQTGPDAYRSAERQYDSE